MFGVLCTGTCVYAANKLLAKDVVYQPKDKSFSVDNVGDALDKLYENKISNEYVRGTLSSSNYGQAVTVELGFEPSIVFIIITTSNGYMRSFEYVKDKYNNIYDRGISFYSGKNGISIVENGFKINIYDSSWGTENIIYYAWK